MVHPSVCYSVSRGNAASTPAASCELRCVVLCRHTEVGTRDWANEAVGGHEAVQIEGLACGRCGHAEGASLLKQQEDVAVLTCKVRIMMRAAPLHRAAMRAPQTHRWAVMAAGIA